ncbi:MAG: ATP phosphoribosyltransferase regulatory subunit [Spirochaetaceae bacterium]|nr:ATP phosphoribosyltransferase regulatory subunit [Spirochaetaceae bacterium]
MSAYLQAPRAGGGLPFGRATARRRLREGLLDLFALWGYRLVETPVFDYFEAFRPVLDPEMLERVYRLIDRDGELLLVRSDVTLFAARLAARTVPRAALPLRLCYADSVVRHEDAESISHNESYQVGAELIGRSGVDADTEIIALCLRALEHAGVRGVALHVGSRAVFDGCYAQVPEDALVELRGAIRDREWAAVRKRSSAAGVTHADALAELFAMIGGVREIEDRVVELGDRLPGAARKAVAHLVAVADALGTLDLPPVRLDLSELGAQSYYSGIVMSAYVAGAGGPVAVGGRYDGLLGRFGGECPSTGFALLLGRVERHARRVEVAVEEPVDLSGSPFTATYRQAEALRARGRAAIQ